MPVLIGLFLLGAFMLHCFRKPEKGRRRVIEPEKRIDPANLVRRITTPLWQEKRWKQVGDEFAGFYRTRYGSYEGRIKRRYGGFYEFYIQDPPACLQNHSHFRCFVLVNGNLYRVHFSLQGRCIDDGIVAIEKILGEAHQLALRA